MDVAGQSSASVALSDALADMYHAFQETIVVERALVDGSLKNLVTFDDAKLEPVHRWFNFKEGYSPRLLPWVLARGLVPNNTRLQLLDPYCGVGTTLLASMSPPCDERISLAVGIERNPAIHAIAQAKTRWPLYSVDRIAATLACLRADKGRQDHVYAVPSLSTFSETRRGEKRAFAPTVLQDLLYYQQWIAGACGETAESAFFMAAWTAIIEKASNTRKDGRALRLLPEVTTGDVKALLLAQCEVMLADVRALQGASQRTHEVPMCRTQRTRVLLGDARELPFDDGAFTLICYSPPYLNNIDYTEVYKLELWLRGDVTSHDAFRALRLSTFRSHPSIIFPHSALCDGLDHDAWIVRLKAALLAALPEDRFLSMRRRLFAGYIDDLILSLREQHRVAAPGAPIICVIGNSLHGGAQKVLVCSDLLIAAAAQAVGLVVDRLQIARQLPRRDHQNGWLRETILVMHKPHAIQDDSL